MSHHLVSGDGEVFRLPTSWWFTYLAIAEVFGWKAAGTVAPIRLQADREWRGRYDTNDGQAVTDDDAAALRNALCSASQQTNFGAVVSGIILSFERGLEAQGIATHRADCIDPSGIIEDTPCFVAFLSKGGFRIE